MTLIPRTLSALLAASAMLAAGAAHAEFPERPINMVVPFAAGGPTDNVARSLAEAMRHSLGQTVVVENKGGAGGTIGTTQVARAQPDGYSVLLMHAGFSTAPSLYKNPGYDPYKSFEPIGLVVDVPMTIIARSDFPPNNIQELADYVKKNKDKVSLANAGIGAASHLCGTMLVEALGVQLLTIPYKGTAPAMNDLLGKQVDLLCDQTTNTTGQITAKKVQAYAVTTPKRLTMPALKDLPTLAEVGVPDFQVTIWHGLYAPKGTPADIVKKVNEAMKAALKDPEFIKRQEALGAVIASDGRIEPEGHKKFVQAEIEKWGKVIKAAGTYAD